MKVNPQKSINISVVGSVDRSDLLSTFNNDEISSSRVGLRYVSKEVLQNDQDFRVKVWDIPFDMARAITPSGDDKTEVIMMVYDVANKKSFNDITRFIKDISRKESACDMIKFVVGRDFGSQDRVISSEDGKGLASEFGVSFMEISGQEKKDVEDLFSGVISQIDHQISDKEEGRRLFGRSSSRVSPVKSRRNPDSVVEGAEIDFENQKSACCTIM